MCEMKNAHLYVLIAGELRLRKSLLNNSLSRALFSYLRGLKMNTDGLIRMQIHSLSFKLICLFVFSIHCRKGFPYRQPNVEARCYEFNYSNWC